MAVLTQTGDPSGTGKGGQSIWGEPFEDEIRPTHKFHARGVVAMANSGPNTNKSQVRSLYLTHAVLYYLQQAATSRWEIHDLWQGD